MKPLRSLVVFSISCLFTLTISFGQCSFSLTAGDTTLCNGDTTSLTAMLPGSNNLITTLSAGNNHRGNMFDITATNTIIITQFDGHPMNNTTVAIYYKVGTFLGFTNNPGAWTLIGTAPVTAQPFGTPTPFPIPMNITIPAGQTYAFYITSTNTGVSLNYSNGTTVGNVYASDANIQFKEGGGLEYPFTAGSGTVYMPRIWNGVIHYALPATYLWNTGETTQTITVNPNTNTTYSVDVTIPSCTTLSDSIAIQVSSPSVDLGTDQTICINDQLLLDAGPGANSYAWSTTDTTQTILVDGSTYGLGSYSISATITTLDGCTAADTVDVTVTNITVVDLGMDQSICLNTQTALDAGSGASSYTWSTSDTTQAIIVDGSLTGLGSFDYSCTVLNPSGCSATDTITITVNDLPVVNLGSDQNICMNTSTILDAGSGASSYAWNTSEASQTIVVDGSTWGPGSFDFSVTTTNSLSCANSDTVNILIAGLPVVTLPGDVTICNNDSLFLDAGSGFNHYQWSGSATSDTTQTIMIHGSDLALITYGYYVAVTDNNGCTNTDDIMISVMQAPYVYIGANQVLCSNNSIVLDAGPGFSGYLWNDGTSTQTNLVNGALLGPGSYDFFVIVTSSNGCTSSDTMNIHFANCSSIESFGTVEVKLYPNPADEWAYVTIQTDKETDAVLKVINSLGQLVYQEPLHIDSGEHQLELNVAGYAQGLYFIEVNAGDHKTVLRFMVN